MEFPHSRPRSLTHTRTLSLHLHMIVCVQCARTGKTARRRVVTNTTSTACTSPTNRSASLLRPFPPSAPPSASRTPAVTTARPAAPTADAAMLIGLLDNPSPARPDPPPPAASAAHSRAKASARRIPASSASTTHCCTRASVSRLGWCDRGPIDGSVQRLGCMLQKSRCLSQIKVPKNTNTQTQKHACTHTQTHWHTCTHARTHIHTAAPGGSTGPWYRPNPHQGLAAQENARSTPAHVLSKCSPRLARIRSPSCSACIGSSPHMPAPVCVCACE